MIKKFAKLNLCILSLIVFNNSIAQITSGNAFLPAIQTGQLQAADVMCVSENGKVLLTTSSVGDETLIWNLRSGKLLKKIRSSGCKFLSVSESGGIAVLGSVASIKWFDLYTCEMLGEVIARGVITDVAINAKGTQVAIGIYDQGVHIIDLKKRLIIKKLLDTTAALGTISGVKFLKNDSLLAYSFFNGQINIYNTQNWILNNQYNFNGLVKNMAFTKDAEWGLYNEGTDSVFLFHNKSGKVLSSWGVKSAFYNMPLDVSSDGHWGVAGSDDGYVTLIDLTNNSVAREIKAHQSQVSAVKFTPDAKYFISAGLDGAIKQFSIYNEKSPVDIGLVNSEISNIVYEGHGNNVLYFGANTLNLFDLKMSSLHSIAKINSENVAPQDDLKDILGIVSNGIFGFDPYSHHIAKASKSSFCLVGFDNYSTLFDVSTSNVKIEKIQGIAPFCIASSGNYALFSSLDGSKILHYDLKNNKLSGSFPKVDNMNVLCISADGKKGYSSYKDNSIAIWDLTTVCRQIKNLKSKENGVILSMIISSDNNRMYVSRSGGIIEMWDIKNFKLIKSFGQQSFMNTSMQLTDKVKIADEFKQMAFSIAFSSSHLSLDDSSGLLMYALNMGTIFLYDIRNDHTKILSINPKSEIKHVEIKPGGQYAYIQYDNNAIDYFDLNNETVKSTFIPVNQSDFIEITPDNYYFATKNP